MTPFTEQRAYTGLTSQQVAQRHEAGQSNFVPRTTSRPVSQILRANIFTTFNGILSVATLAVLLVGDWRDAVFGLVMVLNSAIGVFSELRAKKTLDSVSVLQALQSLVLRDGQWQEVPSADLVLGDVVELRLGDQVPADGKLLSVNGLETDESILTGESLPVHKQVGDSVQSGTAVVSGSGVMETEKIGADALAQQITNEAKKFSLAVSEIQTSIDKILRGITWLIPLVLAIMIWSQLRVESNDWKAAIVLSVAGVVGMIPQGLVLLTSMNFGIAAATLARRGVLVQELPAVEILARVDRLCLDKTGTLTTGGIRGQQLVFAPETEPTPTVLGVIDLLTEDGANASSVALQSLLAQEKVTAEKPQSAAVKEIPFSSIRKWSALVVARGEEGAGTWVLGAPEILLESSPPSGQWAADLVAESSQAGHRTICLVYSSQVMADEDLPAEVTVVAVAVLAEDIRPDAKQTLAYFRDQGVGVRVISGDAPRTVAAIAAEVGLTAPDGSALTALDSRTLPDYDDPKFSELVAKTDVFGRVTPDQKRDIVHAMQQSGHTVAMTGDGVNDALALKQADLGIAMGNGAPATRAVSRLVLMNGEFSVLPGVVAEGRRIIANMERVSSLFLSKTMYSFLLILTVSALGLMYPFLPRQLTFIGWFTIGVPAFILALAPNTQRYRPGFLRRTLLISVPTGIIAGLAALTTYLIVGPGTTAGQTAVTLTVIIAGLWLVGITARPFNWWKVALIVSMAAGTLLGVLIVPVRIFFALDWPTNSQWAVILIVAAVACVLIEVAYRVTARWRNESSAGDRQEC